MINRRLFLGGLFVAFAAPPVAAKLTDVPMTVVNVPATEMSWTTVGDYTVRREHAALARQVGERSARVPVPAKMYRCVWSPTTEPRPANRPAPWGDWGDRMVCRPARR